MKKSSKLKQIKRHPVVLHAAKLDHPKFAATPSGANGALLIIVQTFAAPPDLCNLHTGVGNTLKCINQLLTEVPEASIAIDEFKKNIESVHSDQSHQNRFDQPAGLAGRRGAYAQWDLITRDLSNMPSQFLLMVGVEFARAFLVELGFSLQLTLKLLPFTVKPTLSLEEQDWLTSQFIERKKVLLTLLQERSKGMAPSTSRFNLQVVTLLMAQSSPLRIEERQAAGRINELGDIELAATFKDLRAAVEADDGGAAKQCVAFCFGLSYEISGGAEIAQEQDGQMVVSINPLDGTTVCDLTRVFALLAKTAPPGCIATSFVLVRPLPQFLADYLYRSCAEDPLISFVDDLSPKSQKRSKTLTVENFAHATLKITIARLIASRGAVFLRAGVARDTAAYCSLSLSLLDASDHHYLIKTRQEIWQGCDNAFKHIGWGPAVQDPDVFGPAFGSKRTPEKRAIEAIVAKKMHGAQINRPGKNYKIESLIRHHNNFIAYVGLMFIMFLGGRNRNVVCYQADIWMQPFGYGVHIDKPAAPNQSRVPLAIPVTLARQIVYLKAHLLALDSRLEAKGLGADHPARVRIALVLAGGKVDLLFAVSAQFIPTPLRKTALINQGQDGVTFDSARHFMPNELPAHGVHFDCIQAWLRHHANGNSISADTKAVVPAVWLSEVAAALDKVALDIGLRPLHGITKG
jgi:hypothetical protein